MSSLPRVPYHRATIGDAEIDEVVRTLKSGWLTTGPVTRRFEEAFAAAVGARHAVAVNSATAAMHIAVEALGLRRGQAVFVPTLTFAATAEIVRYLGAVPVLVDCDPATLCMDPADLERKLNDLREGRLPPSVSRDLEPVGMIPVYVGGLVPDQRPLVQAGDRHGLWIVEDAAHAFPAAWRVGAGEPWRRIGGEGAAVTCFSFYANKTITTGEGGMAVTSREDLAERMRLMSLHGLSKDAWGRYAGGPWDYRIVAPGFKYNLTDIAAAIGVHQLARAEDMRSGRERIAARYDAAFADLDEVELPPRSADSRHSWHLYAIRLRLNRLTIDRDEFLRRLTARGIGFSVHWRPLHLHPYYEETFGWKAEHLPVATREWPRLVSLPIFDSMRDEETERVIADVREICAQASTRRPVPRVATG